MSTQYLETEAQQLADAGDVRGRIVRAAGPMALLPVILCFHGGRVLGNAGTHDRLVSSARRSAPRDHAQICT